MSVDNEAGKRRHMKLLNSSLESVFFSTSEGLAKYRLLIAVLLTLYFTISFIRMRFIQVLALFGDVVNVLCVLIPASAYFVAYKMYKRNLAAQNRNESCSSTSDYLQQYFEITYDGALPLTVLWVLPFSISIADGAHLAIPSVSFLACIIWALMAIETVICKRVFFNRASMIWSFIVMSVLFLAMAKAYFLHVKPDIKALKSRIEAAVKALEKLKKSTDKNGEAPQPIHLNGPNSENPLAASNDPQWDQVIFISLMEAQLKELKFSATFMSVAVVLYPVATCILIALTRSIRNQHRLLASVASEGQ